MRKRFLAGMLSATIILSLVSCGTTTDPQIQSQNLMQELVNPTTGEENPIGVTEPVDTPGGDTEDTTSKATLAEYEGQYPISEFGIRLM